MLKLFFVIKGVTKRALGSGDKSLGDKLLTKTTVTKNTPTKTTGK